MFGWYFYCFTKYFTFKGRASRAEYWSFTLINIVILFLLSLFSGEMDAVMVNNGVTQSLMNPIAGSPGLVSIVAVINAIYSLLVICPSISVTIRRLHDRDHTGWWVWAQLIPILNFVVLVFLLLGSLPQPNQYGLRAPKNPNDEVPPVFLNPYGYFQGASGNPQNFDNVREEFSPRQQESYNNPNQETYRQIPQPSQGSVMDEMMKSNEQNTDVQAGLPPPSGDSATETKDERTNHRPMGAEESSMVSMLKKLAGKK